MNLTITKKPSFLLALVLCISSLLYELKAQENTFEDVRIRAFSGVQPLGNNGYYFSSFSGKNETKGENDFRLTFLDNDLNVKKEKILSLSKYSDLAGSAATDNHVLFVFYDYSKRNVTYMTFDAEGNTIATREISKVKRRLLTSENFPYVFPQGDNFVVVKAEKEDKVGYNIEMVDKDLKSLNSLTFAPEKKEMEILDIKMLDDKLYVLRQTAPKSGKTFSNEVVKHDAKTGVEDYVYSLYDGTHSGYPTFVRVNEGGNLYTGGMYFEGTKTSNTDSEGFFYLQLDNSGKSVAYEKHDWGEVKKFFKEKGTSAVWGGKTKIIVQDIVLRPDNSLAVIGEAFRKSKPGKAGDGKKAFGMPKAGLGSIAASASGVKGPNWAYTLMDLNIFEFDAEGNFVNARKIFKPDQVVYVKSEKKVRGLSMAMELKRNGYFGYKYSIEEGEKQYLVTRMIAEKGKLITIPKKSVHFIPLEAFGIEESGSVDVRSPTVREKKKGFANAVVGAVSAITAYDETLYDTTDDSTDSFYYNYDNLNGSVYHNGELLFFNYNVLDATLRVWKDKIPVKG
ncbi:MAG: DUF6770 family protein [Bacteroidota bacterium]